MRICLCRKRRRAILALLLCARPSPSLLISCAGPTLTALAALQRGLVPITLRSRSRSYLKDWIPRPCTRVCELCAVEVCARESPNGRKALSWGFGKAGVVFVVTFMSYFRLMKLRCAGGGGMDAGAGKPGAMM